MSLVELGEWLSGTGVSQWVRMTSWAVPALQSVHILAVATLMATVVLLDLRVLGLGQTGQPAETLARRARTPLWTALAVLAVTGAILVAAEPNRAIGNRAFTVKMALLVLVLLLTAALMRKVSPTDAETAGSARILAMVSLMIWAAIVFAGRWIAYA